MASPSASIQVAGGSGEAWPRPYLSTWAIITVAGISWVITARLDYASRGHAFHAGWVSPAHPLRSVPASGRVWGLAMTSPLAIIPMAGVRARRAPPLRREDRRDCGQGCAEHQQGVNPKGTPTAQARPPPSGCPFMPSGGGMASGWRAASPDVGDAWSPRGRKHR